MIVIFTLESKIGFINLGFGTYYDHCTGLSSNEISFTVLLSRPSSNAMSDAALPTTG